MGDVRAHVIISGKVQGVYFRSETQRAAENNEVFGWVKNRRDGKVEALFEGDEDDVRNVLDWCRDGSTYSQVKDVKVEWEEFAEEFDGFEIVY